MMTSQTILNRLKDMADPYWANNSMARFGITVEKAYGIPVPKLRAIAKEIGKDHRLALTLWRSGIHEARILATVIDDPKQVTLEQMEEWVSEFNSWDICDHACGNLLDKTPFAYQKAVEWSSRKEEYVKRAGFALMAYLAVHDKKAENSAFIAFLPIIELQATDERNFVKKAVNWALREIGKRNKVLREEAVESANRIKRISSKSARWIASNALRELTSPKIIERVDTMQTKKRE